MATHFDILDWRILMERGVRQATVHGVAMSQTRLSDFHFTSHVNICTALNSFTLLILEREERGTQIRF